MCRIRRAKTAATTADAGASPLESKTPVARPAAGVFLVESANVNHASSKNRTVNVFWLFSQVGNRNVNKENWLTLAKRLNVNKLPRAFLLVTAISGRCGPEGARKRPKLAQ